MARIRTVKPELFKHEDLFELEQETGLPIRLAFIGLFTCCDRAGRFKWRPRSLKLDVLPYDDCDFSRVLDALMTRGFVQKYEVDGEEYGVIPTFAKHQIINNRESESELPGPPEFLEESSTSTRDSRVENASSTRHEGKGKEGKGKEGASTTDAPPLPASPPTRIGELCVLLRRAGVNTSPDAVGKADWSANPGVTDDIVRTALDTARKRGPRQITPAYLSPIIADLLAEAKAADAAKLVAGRDYV
jgi:hypothetical protein